MLSVDGIPARVTNNCLEAVNRYLQEEVGNQKVPWEVAILGLSRYVDQKFGQISGAPFGHGEYRLKPNFQGFFVNPQQWTVMTQKEREAYLNKVSVVFHLHHSSLLHYFSYLL